MVIPLGFFLVCVHIGCNHLNLQPSVVYSSYNIVFFSFFVCVCICIRVDARFFFFFNVVYFREPKSVSTAISFSLSPPNIYFAMM